MSSTTARSCFDLLGFTHHWGKARSGRWVVKRRTAKDRFRRALARVVEWCKHHRHDPLRVQQQALARKLNGHYEYFGITGNYEALSCFRQAVKRAWCKWLSRRSQRWRNKWERFNKLLERFALPDARITHRIG